MRLREDKQADLIGVTEIEALAQEIVDFAGSPESRLFYFKAINFLGPELVRQAVSEVKYRDRIGQTRDRARHLTWTLRTWMEERGWQPDPAERVLTQTPRDLGQTPPPSLLTFDDLKPVLGATPTDAEPIAVPYGRDVFPWVLCVNNDFFTLTNEKAKCDVVETSIVVKGKEYRVPMIRGKKGRNDAERGIPTAEHMRVLMATVKIWSVLDGRPKDEGGGPVTRIEKGGYRLCVVETTVPEIAAEMGLGRLGGTDYKRIEEKLQDLGSTGYTYLLRDVPELKSSGIDDKSFQFFGEVDTTGVTVNGRREARVRIFFSSRYSAWLMRREVVTRPLHQMRIRGDIALKLYVHLYPKLMVKPTGDEYAIELIHLIKKIGLKKMGWQLYPSQRKREFEKATREINGTLTTDGRAFSLEIAKGLNKADFLLVAKLVKNDAVSIGD